MSQPPTPAPGSRINVRGAVDLSGLTQRRPPASPPAAGAGAAAATPGGVVVDVTDATFAALVQQSTTVPVVVDLWATWCDPCRQLSPVLEQLATEYGGRLLLAKVDVDANPQIAQAFQVQSIPSVVAILKGQPVPLFQGAYPADQVRQILDELLRVAAENGVTGTVGPGPGPEGTEPPAPPVPPLPPLHAQAREAIERDDLAGAAAAYRQALAQDPRDAAAGAGLAQVELLRRVTGVDLTAARAAAADAVDVDAQLVVADLDLAGGQVEDAFTRLLAVVRATTGDDRERVRLRLVELFEVVGGQDDRVRGARRALAAALF